MNKLSPQVRWIIQQHVDTNHMYDTYLPYEFHLSMAVHIFEKFSHLLDDSLDYYSGEPLKFDRDSDHTCSLRDACLYATWGHDLIEDTRVSYNDVKNVLGSPAADIIYAVTNEKGKNRKERANTKYYDGIRRTPGAVFVKLCDRIANVTYGKMTGSRMPEMYQKENAEFEFALGRYTNNKHLEEMFQYLENLFKSEL